MLTGYKDRFSGRSPVPEVAGPPRCLLVPRPQQGHVYEEISYVNKTFPMLPISVLPISDLQNRLPIRQAFKVSP